jgi:hypothetical protein
MAAIACSVQRGLARFALPAYKGGLERSRTEDTEGFGRGRLVVDGFWRWLSRLTGFHAACGTDRSRRP